MQQQALDIFPKPDIELWQGDCLEIMPDIPDGLVDMVMADPPYGTTACKWDSVIPLEPMWEQLKRVIKPNGAIVLTASQPFTTTLISSNMGMFKYEWIWDKISGANFMNLANRPLKTQEQVLIFSKTANFTFNPIRVYRSSKSLKRHPKGIAVDVELPPHKVEHYGAETYSRIKFSADGKKHPIDIIRFSIWENGRYKIKHSTKKPVALMEYLIKTYTNEGDTVLDFCMGSGTTGVACRNLNRNFIGIEKDPEYFKIAQARING
ncbi:MAG: site-specific DNA-methyltransferase [Nanoarchaeota archaeon]|nr:site-specific DNA-methyltransferase [Nanoarchaeota archaeon]